MKDLLSKIGSGIGGLLAAYIILLASFHGCVISHYTLKEDALYVYEEDNTDFQHGVYLSGNRIAVYRGARDGSCGESAIQVVNFRKWDWYFPGVYVKPDSFFIFGLRFMNSDCTPTTMEWKTIYNQATEDCKPYYTDREWFRASVKFYTDYVIIGDSKYQKIKIERAPSHLKRLKNLVTSDLKN